VISSNTTLSFEQM